MREPSVRATDEIRIQPSLEGDVGLRANCSKVPAATRKELLRDQFISEVAEHLLLHKGPDSDGRAHPTVKRIQVDILENAIEQAKSRGLGGEWRPYHFSGHVGTYQNPRYVDEVLKKKCDQLLAEKFKGVVFRLLTEVTKEDLTSPLMDTVAGRNVSVSMSQVGSALSNSPFAMVKRYIKLEGLSEYSEVRPYHLGKAPQGTFDDPAIVDEVLKKKCDQLLAEKLKSDVFRLLTEVTQEDLLSPLVDTIGGRTVSVSMRKVGNRFSDGPFAMIKRYVEIEGFSEYSELRPYHLSKAPQGTFDDPAVVDEALKKKWAQLLAETFNGDVFRLLTEATLDDLRSPFTDTVGDRNVSVSLRRVANKFANSPFAMMKHCLELEGITRYSELRPYHLSMATMGTYDDPAVVDEVLKKKCDQLLAEKFEADVFRLLTEATLDDLLSPFTDTVGGRNVSVKMSSVGRNFSNSPFEMLERYFRLCTKPITFTRECLLGSSETKARRLRGDFNAYDRKLMRTAADDFDTRKFGMRVFDSMDKGAVRELMLDVGIGVLRETPVKYLGLEDQHLEGIRLFHSYLNLSPKDSVIVERDERVFTAMNSLRKSLPNGEGKALTQVRLVQGLIEDEIPHLEGKFNLVNLDFVGHLSHSNVKALRELFSGRLEDKAVIAVTLMDTPLARERTERAGLGENGARELPRIIENVSKELGLYTVETIGEVPYSGGTGGKATSMITQLFFVRRQGTEGHTNFDHGKG